MNTLKKILAWSLYLFSKVSSLSYCPDPWPSNERFRSTISSTLSRRRRRITLLEASKLAFDILHQAEMERAAIAQAEAEKGISWEE